MSSKLYVQKRGPSGGAHVDYSAFTGRKGVPFFDGGISTILLGQRAYNGEASQGTFKLMDPDAELPKSDFNYNLPAHSLVTWTEDDPGAEVWLSRGRISGADGGRGLVLVDDEVDFDVTVDDSNCELRGQAFTAPWVRPAETDVARILALQAYTLNGSSSTADHFRETCDVTVDTSHLAPNSNTFTMPAKTYPPGTQPDDVIRDCSEMAAKIYAVVIHHTGGSHLCLLYIVESNHTTYASDIKISDHDDEWDPGDPTDPVFEPHWEQGKASLYESQTLLSGMVGVYGNPQTGTFVQHDNTLESNDYWVEPYFDSTSTSSSQAAGRTAGILESRRLAHVTHRVSIIMASDQVDMVAAGMSLEIKAAAALGGQYLNTYQTRRVAECQFEPRIDGTYWAHLQLDRPPLRSRPSTGSPTASLLQGHTGGCTDSFSRTILPGAWGVGEMGKAWGISLLGSGVGDEELAKEAYYVDDGIAYYDAGQISGAPIETTASASISGDWPLPAWAIFEGSFLDHGYYASEYELPWVVCSSPVYDDDFTFHMRWIFGDYQLIYYVSPHNPGAGTATYEVWVNATVDGPGDSGYAIGADPNDSTTLVATWAVPMSDISGKYCVGVDVEIDPDLRVDSDPSGWGGEISYTPTSVTARAWKAGSAGGSVTISAITPSAPSLLKFQPMRTTEPAGDDTIFRFTVDVVRTSGNCTPSSELQFDLGTADGVDTVFTVPTAPYEPGTLQVWLDGLDQTPAITETDPSAGTFTFSFTPLAGERIVVEYRQGMT